MPDRPHSQVEPRTRILELLDRHRVMIVATLRPDGWPQATMVGYAHDDLTLYFVVARTSQKLANIERDARVSIALGHQSAQRLSGLSMAAEAAPVTDLDEIERLNALLRERYPEETLFSPRETSTAIIRAIPKVISIIDLGKGPGAPQMLKMTGSEARIRNTRHIGPGRGDVSVRYAQPSPAPAYRPDAPP